MFSEGFAIEAVDHNDRRHAGAAVAARHGNTIGRGIENAGAIPDRIIDFAGCDILAFPAEGIADPIDEMEIALFVEHHQVAGPKPGIAFREHVTQNLLLGFGRIRVAVEAAAAFIGDADAPDRFAGFSASTGDAKPGRAANGAAAVRIDLHDRDGKTMRQHGRNPADGAGLAIHVEQGEITFGHSVKLEDLRDREARRKCLPDIAAQSVAAGKPQAVLCLGFATGCLQQIAAELADVLKHCALETHDVVPEIPRREFVHQHHRAACTEHAAGCDDAANRMIDRQAIVESIVDGRVHQAGEPTAPVQDAAMADVGGFRQTRCTGGVDQERTIVDRDLGSFGHR